ncbi:MAG: DUF6514 family protein [Oscillospiraceae bacterium]|nr:DUF6514 family protein [Oscillospiraceae bacterium]
MDKVSRREVEEVASAEALISRAYVKTESGAEHILEYYIFAQAPQSDGEAYGITVKQHTCGEVLTQSKALTESKDKVLQLAECLSRNFVFPDSLPEVLEDLGYTN